MKHEYTGTKYRYFFVLPGFIGVFLGFVTGNYYYFVLSPTFLFLLHKGDRDDERWERNFGRAGRNAFLLIMVILILCITYTSALKVLEISPLVIPTLLLVGVSGFMLSYAYYDRRGD